MNRVETPQARCRAGFARGDITPPVGIYHRLWGAALHERSTGVHRPLTATALWMASDDTQLLFSLDQCLLDAEAIAAIRDAVRREVFLEAERIHVAVSHTHASGWMSRSRAAFPGGELIEPYLCRVAHVCADVARRAMDAAKSATIVFGIGRCGLAANRDFVDPTTGQYVCGFNPEGPADDNLLVGRAIAEDGSTLGTLVNYACHPTTLAWENTLLSPDYVGAMREVIERETAAPCLFLQGASGDLGPHEGFTGDTTIADRNGRQLGFAALSALSALSTPGTDFVYTGPVVSGATLGIWKHEPTKSSAVEWLWRTIQVDLSYRPDLPTAEATRASLTKWQAAEADAANDLERMRDAHAHVERMTRQLTRLAALPAGTTYPFRLTLGRTGTVLWVLTPGELYQIFQTELRARFPAAAVVVSTLTDDWQPGYLPTAASYGKGIYQETIALLAPGSLETLIETVANELTTL
jgi:hypothetical protein